MWLCCCECVGGSSREVFVRLCESATVGAGPCSIAWLLTAYALGVDAMAVVAEYCCVRWRTAGVLFAVDVAVAVGAGACSIAWLLTALALVVVAVAVAA